MTKKPTNRYAVIPSWNPEHDALLTPREAIAAAREFMASKPEPQCTVEIFREGGDPVNLRELVEAEELGGRLLFERVEAVELRDPDATCEVHTLKPIWRTPVAGGWLVRSEEGGLTFVPDTAQMWR